MVVAVSKARHARSWIFAKATSHDRTYLTRQQKTGRSNWPGEKNSDHCTAFTFTTPSLQYPTMAGSIYAQLWNLRMQIAGLLFLAMLPLLQMPFRGDKWVSLASSTYRKGAVSRVSLSPSARSKALRCAIRAACRIRTAGPHPPPWR